MNANIVTIRQGNVDAVHPFRGCLLGKAENVLAVHVHAQRFDRLLNTAFPQKRIIGTAGRLRQCKRMIRLPQPR